MKRTFIGAIVFVELLCLQQVFAQVPAGCPLNFDAMEVNRQLSNRASNEAMLQDYAAACATAGEMLKQTDDIRQSYEDCGWRAGAIQLQTIMRSILSTRQTYCSQAREAREQDQKSAMKKKKQKRITPPEMPLEIIEENP